MNIYKYFLYFGVITFLFSFMYSLISKIILMPFIKHESLDSVGFIVKGIGQLIFAALISSITFSYFHQANPIYFIKIIIIVFIIMVLLVFGISDIKNLQAGGISDNEIKKFLNHHYIIAFASILLFFSGFWYKPIIWNEVTKSILLLFDFILRIKYLGLIVVLIGLIYIVGMIYTALITSVKLLIKGRNP